MRRRNLFKFVLSIVFFALKNTKRVYKFLQGAPKKKTETENGIVRKQVLMDR